MVKLDSTARQMLASLGFRLRKGRITLQDTQEEFGARIGVSRHTIIKMEQGNPNTSLGDWLKASSILSLLDSWNEVLQAPVDPFEEYDQKQAKMTKLKKTRVRKPQGKK